MGCLYKFERSGLIECVASGFGVCNGIAWNTTKSEMYLLDTLERTLIAFQYNEMDGGLGSTRLVYDFMNVPGKPHGLVVDSHDHIWVAMWGGNRIVKIDEIGNPLEQVIIPTPNVTACAFGNAESELFVTSARFRNSVSDLQSFPGSGNVFCVNVT